MPNWSSAAVATDSSRISVVRSWRIGAASAVAASAGTRIPTTSAWLIATPLTVAMSLAEEHPTRSTARIATRHHVRRRTRPHLQDSGLIGPHLTKEVEQPGYRVAGGRGHEHHVSPDHRPRSQPL